MEDKKLKNLIEESRLTQAQKDLWFNFIENTPEDEHGPIWEILKENPATLEFLTENLEVKMKAIERKDKNLWNEVLEKEKEYLRKYGKS